MPSISASTTFEFNGRTYITTGICEYAGPYFEFEGVAELTIINRDSAVRIEEPSDRMVRMAEDALNNEAQDDLNEARHGAYEAYGNPDDDYYDYDSGYSSGPDYWVDRESGEWRCG